jgi:hypothetical protein
LKIEFKSRLITRNPDSGTNKAYIIIAAAIVACIVFAALKLYTYATIGFAVALVTVLVITIAKKGRIHAVVVSDKLLHLTPTSVTIDGRMFRISEITDLAFHIDAFSGMRYPSERATSSGMQNLISFKYHGSEEQYNFFLQNRQHAVQLCAVIREYYRNRIPVVETDYAGRRTWLMQRIETMEEVEKFKKRHKIP